MKYSKQTVIEGLKHSIEKTKEEIEKYSTQCNGKFAQGRTAHREFFEEATKENGRSVEGVGR